MIVAGEASGDKHGAALARALKALVTEQPLEIFGSGGPEMRAAGVETLVDIRKLAIIGVPEILLALGRFYRAFRTLVALSKTRKPDAVVLIDWPDFNLRLARKLRRTGVTIIYYISPQVWAWRKYRVRAIRRDVDRMLVILPFEEAFYKREGVEVEYVGHPLCGEVVPTTSRDEFAGRHDLDPSRPIIAFLPGSRHKEIHYHMPVLMETARRLASSDRTVPRSSSYRFQGDSDTAGTGARHSRPGETSIVGAAQFIVPVASTIDPAEIKRIIGPGNGPDIKIIEQDTYNSLAHSEIAVVASGTATVEAALLGTPMVIIYKGSELNWRLIRPLIHLDTFGMVNLIGRKRIVTEFIQHDATAVNIASEVEAILTSPERISTIRRELAGVATTLGELSGPASERAARRVMEIAVNRNQ
ncbi:MAG TPA: lipid-A-disaccharide synthase [Blastocatellia bacterium]|nr:lipid-A-disaccharide synthase [Blastocatellia bacterium]